MKLLSRKSPPLGRHRTPSAAEQPTPSLSYYSRRSDQELNIGRGTRRERRKSAFHIFSRFWSRRFGLVILLLAVMTCGFNVLRLSTDAEIMPATSDNGTAYVHNLSTYQIAASQLLAGSIWNRNKITIDTSQLSQKLAAKFPELTNVSVTLPLLSHRPIIYIQSAQPALILSGVSGSFVIGTNGNVLYASNGDESLQQLHLIQVADQSGLKLSLGRQALTASDISFIQIVVAQLAARHFTVSTMTLPAATRELDVHIIGQPYFIKFNLETADARQQAGTFLATQARLRSQNITPAQYIDVRVDGRAYYQ